jgi:hypothetical protein
VCEVLTKCLEACTIVVDAFAKATPNAVYRYLAIQGSKCFVFGVGFRLSEQHTPLPIIKMLIEESFKDVTTKDGGKMRM